MDIELINKIFELKLSLTLMYNISKIKEQVIDKLPESVKFKDVLTMMISSHNEKILKIKEEYPNIEIDKIVLGYSALQIYINVLLLKELYTNDPKYKTMDAVMKDLNVKIDILEKDIKSYYQYIIQYPELIPDVELNLMEVCGIFNNPKFIE